MLHKFYRFLSINVALKYSYGFVYIWTRNRCVYVLHSDYFIICLSSKWEEQWKQKTFSYRISYSYTSLYRLFLLSKFIAEHFNRSKIFALYFHNTCPYSINLWEARQTCGFLMQSKCLYRISSFHKKEKNRHSWEQNNSTKTLLNLLYEFWTTYLWSIRGGSGAAATSKMERFVIIVNGFQPLTIIIKLSVFDVTAILDPPLSIVTRNGMTMRLFCD